MRQYTEEDSSDTNDHQYSLIEQRSIIENNADTLASLRTGVENLQTKNDESIKELKGIIDIFNNLPASMRDLKGKTESVLASANENKQALDATRQRYVDTHNKLVDIYDDYTLSDAHVPSNYHPYFPESRRMPYELPSNKKYSTTELPDGCLTGSTKMLYRDHIGEELSSQEELSIHKDLSEHGNAISEAPRILNETIRRDDPARYQYKEVSPHDDEQAKQQLQDALKDGNSVIVRITKEGMSGHAIVVDHVKENGQDIYVGIRDPYSKRMPAYQVRYEDFAQRWGSYNVSTQTQERVMVALESDE